MRAIRAPHPELWRHLLGLGAALALAACAGGTRAPVSQPEREVAREPEVASEEREATPESDREADVEAEATFRASLERMVDQDPTLDFWQFRREFAATERYAPYGDDSVDDPIEQAFSAIQEERFEDALAAARQALELSPLHPKANFAARAAAQRLGNTDLAEFYDWVLGRLAESICGERSGFDIEDPCPVISVDEEYFFLQAHGFRNQEQSLLSCGESQCDALNAVDRSTNEEVTFYFDVSLPMAYLDKKF